MSDAAPRAPIAAVGVVCFRGPDVLLIRRGAPPFQGGWSIPGGRIEWGERAADAALRELMEETGCTAELVGLIDVIDGVMREGDAPPSAHYVLIDYAARWTEGAPRAGDDAADARFVAPDELAGLGLWSETLRIIEAGRIMVNAGSTTK